jgi:hypothetical protein
MAQSIINNGSIVSTGTVGKPGTGYGASGGSSGGGCIFIFYKEKFVQGTIDVAGGLTPYRAGDGFLSINRLNINLL